MITRQFIIANLLLLLVPVSGHAKCSKEDISFYLEKGFTQDQITQLCASSEEASEVPDYQPYQQKVIVYSNEEGPGKKDGFTKEERKAISDLKAGGDIIKLKVTQTHLKYVRKVCIISGNSPEYDQRFKTCPEVNFNIARDGLAAASSGKKLLVFGTAVVALEGDIDRKLRGNWEDYPITVRKELKRNFNWKEDGHKTDFPVRGDFSVTRIVNAMRTLSTVDSDYFDEAARENDDFEEDQKIAEKEISSETKKKKKWWNPFD